MQTQRLILETGSYMDITQHKFNIALAQKSIKKYCGGLSYSKGKFTTENELYYWIYSAVNQYMNESNKSLLLDGFTAILATELAELFDGVICHANNLEENSIEYLFLSDKKISPVAYRVTKIIESKCTCDIDASNFIVRVERLEDIPITPMEALMSKTVIQRTRMKYALEKEDYEKAAKIRDEMKPSGNFNLQEFKREHGYL